MAIKHQVTNYLQTHNLMSTSFLVLSCLENLFNYAVNSIDGQEQGSHTKEEENWPQPQSQEQRKVQTGQNPQKGPGLCDVVSVLSDCSFPYFHQSLMLHSTLKPLFISARCAMFVGRIRNTAESCLASALVSRKAPNSSKNESGNTPVDLSGTFNVIELFSILKRTLILQLINILNTYHFLYHLYQPT